MSDLTKEVESLVKKASEGASLQALQFSQAALNAANTMRVLADTPRQPQRDDK